VIPVRTLALLAAGCVVLGAGCGGGPSRSSVVPGPAKRKPLGGPLLRDPRALMLASRLDDVLVGIAAVPGRVEVLAVPSSSKRVRVRDVGIAVGTRSLTAEACGRDCFAVAAPVLRGNAATVHVSLAGKGETSIRLPARMPSAAPLRFRAADATMRSLRTVTMSESLSSGGPALKARFVLQAPDRMRYVTSAGDKAVAIGARRWDWEDGRWAESETQPIPQPAYIWAGGGRARLLERRRGVDVIGVFRPDASYPAWFRLFVTPQRRVVRTEMLAPSHFMVDTFSGFDAPVTIGPPR
jgi:hypothetical protein